MCTFTFYGGNWQGVLLFPGKNRGRLSSREVIMMSLNQQCSETSAAERMLMDAFLYRSEKFDIATFTVCEVISR